MVMSHGHLRELRHERQRRAQADVRHLPCRLRPRPDPGGATPEFSPHPRSHRRHRRLHAEARAREALDRARDREAPVGRRVPADTGGAGRVQAVQHVHQLHAVLRRVPDLRVRSQVPRTRGHRARPAVQPRQPRRGRLGSHGGALGARGDLGLHVRWRMHEGVPQERRSGRRHPALQADRRAGVDESRSSCQGVRDERQPRLHAVPSTLASTTRLHLLVARRSGRISVSSCGKAAACSWGGSCCTCCCW